MSKYIEVPSDEPIPHGGKEVKIVKANNGQSTVVAKPGEWSDMPPSAPRDDSPTDEQHFPTNPREVVKTAGAVAKLLDQYGVGVFLIILFTGILVSSLYYARSDANEKDALTRVSHEYTTKLVVDTFSETIKNMRDDSRDEKTRHDVHQSKMYQNMRDIKDSNTAQAALLQKAVDVLSTNGDTMKKSNEVIEKTLVIIIDNGKQMKALIDSQKK
jgi:hypothetical protein